MAYPNLALNLCCELTSEEWDLLSYYIRKANDFGNSGNHAEAKRLLRRAIDIAKINGFKEAAKKINYYTRFYN